MTSLSGLALVTGGSTLRVNAVSPAGVRTPMWRTMPFFRQLIEQHGSEDAAFAAMERDGGAPFATPAAIAAVVAFLVSDDGAWINGVELPVDRGFLL